MCLAPIFSERSSVTMSMHVVVVQHRLTHAHIHEIGNAAICKSLRMGHLIDNLPSSSCAETPSSPSAQNLHLKRASNLCRNAQYPGAGKLGFVLIFLRTAGP